MQLQFGINSRRLTSNMKLPVSELEVMFGNSPSDT